MNVLSQEKTFQWKNVLFTVPDLQVLISGGSSNQKIDKSKKDKNKKADFKREKSKDAPESHAELDSRLLSALLTVSLNVLILAN